MRIKNRKSKKSLLILLAVLFLVLVTGGVVWSYYQSKPNSESSSHLPVGSSKKVKKEETDSSSQKPKTNEQPSVPLPDSVNPSSVKPYTVITENETYKIRELNGDYVITLYAIINRPDQKDAYRDQLRQYKQDALAYLRQHAIDITKVNITYEPEEASQL